MTNRADLGVLSALLGVIWAAGVLLADGTARAEQFRVENKVFVEDEKEPRVESTTIFYAGVVYDYLKEPAEITVFDKARGRFVLLDVARQVKTELTTEAVAAVTERLKEWAGAQPDPYLKFLADPKFTRPAEPDAGELTFASPWVTYRVKPVDAGSAAIARQYREFSDWYGMLNTRINPGARPPFARMILNAELDSRRQLPREVQLTLRPKASLLAKKIHIRSEHQLIRRLVESDRARVAETDRFMGVFNPVDFDDYQKQIENR